MWCCIGNVEYVIAEQHEELSNCTNSIGRSMFTSIWYGTGSIGDDFYEKIEWTRTEPRKRNHENIFFYYKQVLVDEKNTRNSAQKFISCRRQFFAHKPSCVRKKKCSRFFVSQSNLHSTNMFERWTWMSCNRNPIWMFYSSKCVRQRRRFCKIFHLIPLYFAGRKSFLLLREQVSRLFSEIKSMFIRKKDNLWRSSLLNRYELDLR